MQITLVNDKKVIGQKRLMYWIGKDSGLNVDILSTARYVKWSDHIFCSRLK